MEGNHPTLKLDGGEAEGAKAHGTHSPLTFLRRGDPLQQSKGIPASPPDNET